MHFHIEVILKDKPDMDTIDELINELIPDSEKDWFQIGGRFTGKHVKGYDAHKDPNHQESCKYCNGTGTRTDWPEDTPKEWIEQCHGCNACQGTGIDLTWPTTWEIHPMDICQIKDVPKDLSTYAWCVDGNYIVKELWTGERFIDNPDFPKTIADLNLDEESWIITVDCHN